MAGEKDAGQDDAGLGLDDEDRLPWLEAADDYDEDGEVSPTRLLAMVLGGLLLIGAVLGGLWWLQNGGARGQGELIAADKGDYKVQPTDNAARVFEGEGDESFAASEGAAPTGRVDPSRMPEEPAVTPEARAAAAKAATAKAKAAVAPAKAAPAADAKGAGGVIQLGAFSSEAAANKAWASLSKRFAYLSDLNRSVAAADVGGSKVYRLRVMTGSAANASSLCGKLRVAGENCVIVR
ncbi:SPOR domain-containing protein [Sphingopyxis panaciterrulae]|uniref:Cell division protein FtsN n=1 Tax=Sphingopyxis panaciterrulae TaxID=462372 RepID=A0A7W9EQN0_9SPHN|nr:SPOR domain-containing protein [Sphingopyxis panaciterrulae]MBB5706842.1 cell division protein FtsN [Sphingopyxis panaciterrulae]